ncbi:hypothetical protein GCM10010967_20800 [Dyadobacter beijingensis]|uniref:Uncharacterized protein n=1 Tax=Dyadobacter beijingensis TaxID=365489 RepID=A0ABQ2HTV7_9BACT|nr:hypothetical protein [Dyadobacter beijingensis]GGM88028.1 hypothetical protein GCM10010967_20800 [Dyadobacter beijingensis]
MIKITYFALLGTFSLIFLIAIIYYLVKPAPSGDSSVGWAIGIFYLTALLGVILVALLFWRNKTIGLIVLCIPLLFIVIPIIKSGARDLYAWLPAQRATPLTLHIANNTSALVNVKLECWFGKTDGDEQSLYKTLEFTSKPLAVDQHVLSDYDTQLLSAKSAFIRIVFYECLQQSGNGYTYVREVQPCMQYQDVAIEDFQGNDYLITIDGEKNTDAFRAEVRRLKESDMYQNGVF